MSFTDDLNEYMLVRLNILQPGGHHLASRLKAAEIKLDSYFERSSETRTPAMTFDEFRNALTILTTMSNHELQNMGCPLRLFKLDPAMGFLSLDDATARKLFERLEWKP